MCVLWDVWIYTLQVLTVRRRWLTWWVTAPLVGQHSQLVSNFHVPARCSINRLNATWAAKAQGILLMWRAAKCKLSKHATMCNITAKKKMRSETTRKVWTQTQLTVVVGIPVLYVHPDWTTPEASQVFHAAESERQASALQIHHLSLPLLPSGKSVSTTAEEGGR